MLGSLVLLTQTAHITSDIAPVPLLWIAPLAIYLTTFILVFASPIFYLPRIYTYAWPAIGVIEILMGKTDLLFKLGLNLLNVFLLCMICNGELAAAKPPANRLPLYWLCTSIGGVLAGLFVSVLAPLVFSFDLERHLTYCMMIILTLTVIKKRKLFILGYKPTTYTWVGWSSAVLLLLIAGDTLATDTIYRERNFYGSVQVKEDGTYRELVNGQILHGQQFLKPEHRMIPGSYFQLPIAFVDTFLRWRSRGARQEYGVVGLGVGTIAAYGRKGDSIDYFEIDPKIIKIAQSFFSYISGSKATVKLIPGDARATIKALPTEKRYDLLVIDAFNGDAVPVHLLTTEAIQIYLSHVKPDGILMFHVSNRFINLIPPVSSSARTLGLHPLVLDDIVSLYVAFVRSDSEIKAMKDCISENHELLKDLMVQDVPPSTAKGWTDDFANLASYFQFK